jgi:glycosyltransferase involved in cell wall biosynthesis
MNPRMSRRVDRRAAMTSSLPVVTIVIPSFNHAEYLAQAIDSVLAQDYPATELIVLDDGSTDATRDVLARYHGRFFYETHSNRGQAATLNKGWKIARGEILGKLSADDTLLPGAITEVVRVMLENPRALVAYPDYRLIDPDALPVKDVIMGAFDYRKMLVEAECAVGAGALFRRRALQLVGDWDPTLPQMLDYDFWLRAGLYGDIIHVAKVLATFRVHPRSQTYQTVSEQVAKEPVRIISALFDHPDLPTQYMSLRHRGIANANIVSAQLNLRAGRVGAACRAMGTALRLAPASLVRWRTLRVIANALFNRTAHKLLWTVRRYVRGMGA